MNAEDKEEDEPHQRQRMGEVGDDRGKGFKRFHRTALNACRLTLCDCELHLSEIC